MPEYLLPDVGEGLTEAEIVSWKVEVGDTIAINDVVCEIETAKSIVELPSPYAGTVSAILVAEGETVPVGTPIIAIGDGSEPAAPAAPPAEIDLSNPAASGSAEGESLVGRMKAERGAVRRARSRRGGDEEVGRLTAKATVQDTFNAGAPAQRDKVEELAQRLVVDTPAPDRGQGTAVAAPGTANSGDGKALAKPPVRKLAKDLGVDLAGLTGSGDGGVITRADVEAAATAGAPGTSSAEQTRPARTYDVRGGEREWAEPIKGVRKMMAQAMVGSAFSAPHVTEWVTIDATRTMEFVESLKANRDFKDVKVSPLLVIAKACLLAMRRTPEVNSFWDESGQQVVYKRYVNLGIAAATPRGLVVPNIKDAEQMSVRELADAVAALTATAREGRTQPADMAGGTFTITNVGVFGVDSGTPIINPGESAILAVGAIAKRPWVVGDEIKVRHVTTLALSFDHRHIDGALGSQFLADVAAIVADPATALLY